MRAKVEVDPHTAQLTIASDPGVGGIPIIEEGIPLDIRTLNVTIDRPGFIFNPTSCAPQTVAGTISSAGGTSAAVSSPFQAANCASLPFKPTLSALTHAKTSRVDGAYLHVKIVSGPGQANIAKVKVDLPKQLPSRLTTLQKACPATRVRSRPRGVPGGLDRGDGDGDHADARAPLTDPPTWSHTVALAFPALVMVLQGEGITLELEGQTNISKGITSSTFRSLPDVPIGTLDLVFADGPALRLRGEPAGKGEAGPVLADAEHADGDHRPERRAVKQTTRIAVTGCPPTRPKPKRKRKAKRRQ